MKTVLQIDEIVADSSECGVVLSGVAAAMGVLAQLIDLGGERPEVIVRPDMELDGFLLGHASSMHDGH